MKLTWDEDEGWQREWERPCKKKKKKKIAANDNVRPWAFTPTVNVSASGPHPSKDYLFHATRKLRPIGAGWEQTEQQQQQRSVVSTSIMDLEEQGEFCENAAQRVLIRSAVTVRRSISDRIHPSRRPSISVSTFRFRNLVVFFFFFLKSITRVFFLLFSFFFFCVENFGISEDKIFRLSLLF